MKARRNQLVLENFWGIPENQEGFVGNERTKSKNQEGYGGRYDLVIGALDSFRITVGSRGHLLIRRREGKPRFATTPGNILKRSLCRYTKFCPT